MVGMFNRVFWLDAMERAIKSFAQMILAAYTVDAVQSAWSLDWIDMIGVGVTGAVYSVLTSVASGFRKGTISPAGLVRED